MTEENVNKYNGLTIEELEQGYQSIQSHKKVQIPPHVLGCIETTYKYQKRPQVRINNIKYYCAIIAKLYQERLNDENYEIQDGFDASHYYCHNPECVNENHIVFEDHKINKSRLCCRIYGMKEGYECPHDPVCLINKYTQIQL